MSGAVDSVFSALGDSTRRQILEWMDGGVSTTATELALRLPISRQAISKHLGELETAGLAVSSKQGRETRYEANPDGIVAVDDWLAERAATWGDRLERLRRRAVGDDEHVI
jgi:DNA-binding transcriptional ArsR family regulator